MCNPFRILNQLIKFVLSPQFYRSSSTKIHNKLRFQKHSKIMLKLGRDVDVHQTRKHIIGNVPSRASTRK
jgi:hypothetical protein